MYRAYVLVAVAACALAVGCAKPTKAGAGKSTINGKVLFNGNPVAGARVIFTEGKGGGMAAGPTAVTDESGEYAIAGAPAGSYKVVVYKIVPRKGGKLPTDDEGGIDLVQLEASGAGTHGLPTKYSRAESTTLTANVNDGANEVDLKLTGQVEKAP